MHNASEIKLESTISCPECGYQSTEKMPTDACQYFWACPHCGDTVKPEKGDCCVFCTYGDTPCPPVQNQGAC
ncbi:MAG: GDCCVxC domain-containing (seleno)protein [Bacteroidota bacterium]